jgi:hypothetical protein
MATILKLVSVDFKENGLTNRINFDCACWGEQGKVPFKNLCVSIFNMAAMATILKLVSVDYLTNAWVDWSDFVLAYWG